MTQSLGGTELLTKLAVQFSNTLIRPGEKILGCIRATGTDENMAFIALDDRLLYIHPLLKQSQSMEYIDIQRVNVTDESFLGMMHTVLLEVGTTYNRVGIDINLRHRQYAMQFADFLRIKAHEMRMLSSHAGHSERKHSDFVDELERLANLRRQGALTEEEFEAAKRKLLSQE